MSWNQTVSEWKRISARIRSLRENGMVGSGMHGSHHTCHDITKQIFESIRTFKLNFEKTLLENAVKCLDDFINERNTNFNNPQEKQFQLTPQQVSEKIAFLSQVEGEITYHLSESRTIIRKNVEIAFLHLQYQLLGDETIRRTWQSCWEKREGNKKNSAELRFEPLGRAHLLLHKIWSIKASGLRTQTDALLVEMPTDPNEIFDGAVLTEWKQVSTRNEQNQKLSDDQIKKDLNDKIEEAQKEIQDYTNGTLLPMEISRCRYIVIVSHDKLKEMLPPTKEDKENNVTYKFINIITSPKTPSGKDSDK